MQLEGLDHCGDDFGRGSDILADAELLDDQHLVAVLVSVVAHGAEDDAGRCARQCRCRTDAIFRRIEAKYCTVSG